MVIFLCEGGQSPLILIIIFVSSQIVSYSSFSLRTASFALYLAILLLIFFF